MTKNALNTENSFDLYIVKTFHSRHSSLDNAMDTVSFLSKKNEFEYSIYSKITKKSMKEDTFLYRDYSKKEKHLANSKSYKRIFNGQL